MDVEIFCPGSMELAIFRRGRINTAHFCLRGFDAGGFCLYQFKRRKNWLERLGAEFPSLRIAIQRITGIDYENPRREKRQNFLDALFGCALSEISEESKQ